MAFDRREYPRESQQGHVSIEWQDPQGGDEKQSETSHLMLDLSVGGLAVGMVNPPPVGTELNVTFVFDRAIGGESLVDAAGEVTRLSPSASPEVTEVGIKFTYISEESQELLKEHIERRHSSSW